MPFISIHIHFVWSTKNRIPHLKTKDIRTALWQHIRENGKAKGIFIDCINGYQEHCHCLISLTADQTISKVMQLIKGEAAHWFNQQHFIPEKLEWQDEYFAVSVSESMLEKVRDYIKNQEVHHSKKAFQEEYEEFMMKYGFARFKDSFRR